MDDDLISIKTHSITDFKNQKAQFPVEDPKTKLKAALFNPEMIKKKLARELQRIVKEVVKPIKMNHDWPQYGFEFEDDHTLVGGTKIYDLKRIIEKIKAVDQAKVENKKLLYHTEPWMRELSDEERAKIYNMFMKA